MSFHRFAISFSADICHAYQILHRHGIPDDRIVVMMYDDIAYDPENPFPGKIINKPDGPDVYEGVPKDYTKDAVTTENFFKILKGIKPEQGSGKVVGSGPADHLFINLVDHGAVGLFAFPNEILTAKELIDALNQLYDDKRYAKLVIYVESCESGSLFKNHLRPEINIFATTASDWNENSWACYCNGTNAVHTCLGDCYSVHWMEDADQEDIEKETLSKQFEIVAEATNTSHVQEYGDLSIGQISVGEFLGRTKSAAGSSSPFSSKKKQKHYAEVESGEVVVMMWKNKILAETDVNNQMELIEQLRNILLTRDRFKKWMTKTVVPQLAGNYSDQLLSSRFQLNKLECHHRLVRCFDSNCFSFSQNPFALTFAYLFVNLCEMGFKEMAVVEALITVCSDHHQLFDDPIL